MKEAAQEAAQARLAPWNEATGWKQRHALQNRDGTGVPESSCTGTVLLCRCAVQMLRHTATSVGSPFTVLPLPAICEGITLWEWTVPGFARAGDRAERTDRQYHSNTRA